MDPGLPCDLPGAVRKAEMDEPYPAHPQTTRNFPHSKLKPEAPASLTALPQPRGKALGAHTRLPKGWYPKALPINRL